MIYTYLVSYWDKHTDSMSTSFGPNFASPTEALEDYRQIYTLNTRLEVLNFRMLGSARESALKTASLKVLDEFKGYEEMSRNRDPQKIAVLVAKLGG